VAESQEANVKRGLIHTKETYSYWHTWSYTGTVRGREPGGAAARTCLV